MSRLTEIISSIKAKDSQLGLDLEKEFKAFSSRREFGLNFERHSPEIVELPNRKIRKGDKVRILPERGSDLKGDQELWVIKEILKKEAKQYAKLNSTKAEPIISQVVNIDDLIVVAEFNDYIYPGLTSTGKIQKDKNKPFHCIINGENYHSLQALTFTHSRKIDAIYIDPPYNSGAKDWKYNNDYVEADDLYKHSKWLAFIERRLKICRELLNPNDSVLIVTIDEKEYLRLGLLLEQTFPDAVMQMVSSVINPKGTGRANEMLRVNEFIFFLWFGNSKLGVFESADEEEEKIDWETMRRRNLASKRGRKGKGACGPNQFYPIYVDSKSGKIKSIGSPLPETMPISEAPEVRGCVAVFPIRPDGTEINWSLTNETCKIRLAKGYVRAGKHNPDAPQKYIIQYLLGGAIDSIESGDAEITQNNDDGSIEARYTIPKYRTPSTQWNFSSHNAEHNGTKLIKTLLPGRTFPFPKSLYAVEDALRLFLEDKKNAKVLDFFCGSGTTAHAIMRLNKEDGGSRQAILVTNNEVSPEESKLLTKKGYRKGEKEWESLGICEYITKPRIKAAISGKSPDGIELKGTYKYKNEFPLADGFMENAEFFTLTYESPLAINYNLAFKHIAPLLWMRAGSLGKKIDKIPRKGWEMAQNYGVLFDLDKSSEFYKAITSDIRIVFIVTDDDKRFQLIVKRISKKIEPVRLYESYLKNFQFTSKI